MKKETLEEILKKIKSTKLCLIAHPNNEIDSEFADRITDLEEIEIELLKAKSQQGYSKEELKSAFKIGFNIGYGSPVQELDLKNEHCERWFEQFKNK